MIKNVLILGGGSAGFLAALALRVKLPHLPVVVVRSKDIGIIGVGEGSTVGLSNFLHDYLRVNPKKFFDVARPTWKLGLRFLWGPRDYFNYTFSNVQIDGRLPGLRKVKAFYCDADMTYEDPRSAMMTHDRVFERRPDGMPAMHAEVAYHFENERFVRFLEEYATALGVTVLDDKVVSVDQDDAGIRALRMESGRSESADLFVDASGFASVLLGKALGEPFVSFGRSLFCDRAVVGGWDRGPGEPIRPYTVCQTMDAGWCWQIEHESRINRGYVYSSAFICDAAAREEFVAKNPRVGATRVVRFTSGRYRNLWVKNVVAVGNAGGFVEPLEATALGAIGHQSRMLADVLVDADGDPTPSQRHHFNVALARSWDDIRDFLALHYRFNFRLDTPFWRHCQAETDLGDAAPLVAFYRENGPNFYFAPALLSPGNQFGMAGHLALLVGQRVEHGRPHRPSDDEARTWNAARQRNKELALRALTTEQALALIRASKWKWGAA